MNIFTAFLKNKNIIFKIRRSKVTDYAALNDLGFSYIWLHQTDITLPLNAIKQRIYDSYSQSWYAEINNSNRLITNARYKHEFAFESYLDFITEKNTK